jgi:hypothetical protein
MRPTTLDDSTPPEPQRTIESPKDFTALLVYQTLEYSAGVMSVISLLGSFNSDGDEMAYIIVVTASGGTLFSCAAKPAGSIMLVGNV